MTRKYRHQSLAQKWTTRLRKRKVHYSCRDTGGTFFKVLVPLQSEGKRLVSIDLFPFWQKAVKWSWLCTVVNHPKYALSFTFHTNSTVIRQHLMFQNPRPNHMKRNLWFFNFINKIAGGQWSTDFINTPKKHNQTRKITFGSYLSFTFPANKFINVLVTVCLGKLCFQLLWHTKILLTCILGINYVINLAV